MLEVSESRNEPVAAVCQGENGLDRLDNKYSMHYKNIWLIVKIIRLFKLTENLVVPPVFRKVLVVQICVYKVKT
jgi:hypothetical protein